MNHRSAGNRRPRERKLTMKKREGKKFPMKRGWGGGKGNIVDQENATPIKVGAKGDKHVKRGCDRVGGEWDQSQRWGIKNNTKMR